MIIYLQLCKPGQHILDPFSGSGTVLQEAARLGMAATGLEINPSAFAMSSFFELSNNSFHEREKIIFEVKSKLDLFLGEFLDKAVYTKNDSTGSLINIFYN